MLHAYSVRTEWDGREVGADARSQRVVRKSKVEKRDGAVCTCMELLSMCGPERTARASSGDRSLSSAVCTRRINDLSCCITSLGGACISALKRPLSAGTTSLRSSVRCSIACSRLKMTCSPTTVTSSGVARQLQTMEDADWNEQRASKVDMATAISGLWLSSL